MSQDKQEIVDTHEGGVDPEVTLKDNQAPVAIPTSDGGHEPTTTSLTDWAWCSSHPIPLQESTDFDVADTKKSGLGGWPVTSRDPWQELGSRPIVDPNQGWQQLIGRRIDPSQGYSRSPLRESDGFATDTGSKVDNIIMTDQDLILEEHLSKMATQRPKTGLDFSLRRSPLSEPIDFATGTEPQDGNTTITDPNPINDIKLSLSELRRSREGGDGYGWFIPSSKFYESIDFNAPSGPLPGIGTASGSEQQPANPSTVPNSDPSLVTRDSGSPAEPHKGADKPRMEVYHSLHTYFRASELLSFNARSKPVSNTLGTFPPDPHYLYNASMTSTSDSSLSIRDGPEAEAPKLAPLQPSIDSTQHSGSNSDTQPLVSYNMSSLDSKDSSGLGFPATNASSSSSYGSVNFGTSVNLSSSPFPSVSKVVTVCSACLRRSTEESNLAPSQKLQSGSPACPSCSKSYTQNLPWERSEGVFSSA